MEEVEATSDYLITMMIGIYGKSQTKLNNTYRDYDDSLDGAATLKNRFEQTMTMVEDVWGSSFPRSRLRRPALFYTLFASIYDHVYGLGSNYMHSRKPCPLPKNLATKLDALNKRVEAKSLPTDLQDAMDKSTADSGRRKLRYSYFMKELGLESAT